MSILTNANQLLAALVSQASSDWEPKLRELFPDSDANPMVDKVKEQCHIYFESEPVGIYMGSASAAREVVPDGESATLALAVLKRAHRVYQAGRGRGRGRGAAARRAAL